MKTVFRLIVILTVISFTLVIMLSVVFPPDHVEISSVLPEIAAPYLGQDPPGGSAERFAPGIIHEDLHTAVIFSANGEEIYWRPMDDGRLDDILYMGIQNGEWTSPQLVPFASRFYDSDNPCLSPDNQRLFFTSFRPLSWFELFDSKERIWYVERTGSGWSRPKALNPVINSMELHWQLSVSETGTLYFASNDDIYRSVFIDGDYQPPQMLSKGVNTPKDDGHPFISADESYLIFSSNGHRNRVGDYDLFISLQRTDGSWSEAINLGEAVNSPYQDIYPVVSPDERYLFFLSNRGGSHSVYWIDFTSVKSFLFAQSEGS